MARRNPTKDMMKAVGITARNLATIPSLREWHDWSGGHGYTIDGKRQKNGTIVIRLQVTDKINGG